MPTVSANIYWLSLVLPVAKVCNVDVEGQVGHQTHEERLEVRVHHVPELPVLYEVL